MIGTVWDANGLWTALIKPSKSEGLLFAGSLLNAQAEIDGNPRSKIAQYRRPTAPGELPAIVLHELVTNASKYGAFSTPDGRITVRWDLCEDQARLALEWIEAGGPPVVPGQPSFGTGVIRNLIPYELGGTVDLAFQAEGLRCTITLPSN